MLLVYFHLYAHLSATSFCLLVLVHEILLPDSVSVDTQCKWCCSHIDTEWHLGNLYHLILAGENLV